MELHRPESVVLEDETNNDVAGELGVWLVETAEQGVPELVLVALLRAYATTIEDRGYVPRAWAAEYLSE